MFSLRDQSIDIFLDLGVVYKLLAEHRGEVEPFPQNSIILANIGQACFLEKVLKELHQLFFV
jgi:hypothetical protein